MQASRHRCGRVAASPSRLVRERLAALPSSLPRWSGSAPVWSTAYRERQKPQLSDLAVSGGLLRQLEAQPVQPIVRVKHGCLVGCFAPTV